MSINNTGFLQTLIASRTSGSFQNFGSRHDSGGMCGVKSDLWRDGRSNKEMSVKQGESSTEITTPGGYKIIGYGQSQAEGGKLEIIIPPKNEKVVVWGDPHIDKVDEDGKSSHLFDVKNRTTFTLPDDTVITVNMTPSNDGSGTTKASDVMVTNRDKGVLMSNMMSGKGNMTTEEGYGPLMDSMADDGNVLNIGKDGNIYEANRFGGKSKVTQASIDKTEREMGDDTGDASEASDSMLMAQFMKQIQQLLSGFNSDFLRTLQSGSSSSYSSRYPHLGMQNMTLDTASLGWS